MKRFVRGLPKQHRKGEMNATERAYADHLDERMKAGEVIWYAFESIRLSLVEGDARTVYTPDFAVQLADGEMELHEVKGFWQEAARVRIKVAASMYPFRFRSFQKLSKKDGGGWKEEVFDTTDGGAA